MKYSLGLDFGTESARAVLVEVAGGAVVATSVSPYPNGVIDAALPGSNIALASEWALQSAADWLLTLEETVKAVLNQSRVTVDAIIAIGVDFTACTVLPTTATGVPLHTLEDFQDQPHAWVKLWKHHAAQPQADRINALAYERNETWLPRYGGKISSEWLLPKALQMLEEAPQIYAVADQIIEGADWVVWQLTGRRIRNTCAAGYKGTWHKTDGFPDADFLLKLHPQFGALYQEKVQGDMLAPGRCVGPLTAAWAKKLGLSTATVVAAPIIDAHAAALAGGVVEPRQLFMIMGTSTCHMLMSEQEHLVEGISGVVEDGIVPGLFGYEAGQAGVGDIFAWFVEHAVPSAYQREAEARDLDLHDLLTEYAQQQTPGEHGLIALDWWNGCRSTLVDADLSGLLIGATLSTKPEDVYRALIESTAFGTRVIIDAFIRQGVAVDTIVAGGGLTKNELLMQIYADVSGRRIEVIASGFASALGAAMLGAVAAGSAVAGYDTLADAATAMAPVLEKTYEPNAVHQKIYDALFAEYRRLYDTFGRGGNEVMKTLRRIKKGEV